MTINLIIPESKPIESRFIHVSQDNNLRLRKTNEGYILEQNLYANVDAEGRHLSYPETRWCPVRIVE